ncbi:MAG: 5-formyltetrahydrofolate cyclo-ligase [Spirochaetota bacterium]
MQKKQLRKKTSRIRNSIPASEKKKLDANIEKNLLEWEVYKKAGCIFCFVSFRSEVNTRGIIRHSLQTGKQVCVPKIDLNSGEMKAVVITDTEKDLTPGAYGIKGPADYCKEADYASLDLIIAPGLCFSPDGYRLGYGGGFYDRFLRQNQNPVTCAPTYDRLIFNALPVDENDLPVDYLITESGIKSTRRNI